MFEIEVCLYVILGMSDNATVIFELVFLIHRLMLNNSVSALSYSEHFSMKIYVYTRLNL